MGFPSEKMDSARKSSAPPPQTSSSSDPHSESIPIRVIHEKPSHLNSSHVPTEKHRYNTSHRTADLPSSTCPPPEAATNSPRVTRAHSEPPKTFNQRILKTKIPLGNVSEQNEHNLATSASDSSVPHSESQKQPQPPPRSRPSESVNTATGVNPSSEPTVRHIPIRVEGREEPVLNHSDSFSTRKPSDFYPSGVKVERRAQHPPTTLKVNQGQDPAASQNKDRPVQQEPTSPLSPIPSDQPIPMGYTEADNAAVKNGQKANNDSEEPSSPQSMPTGPIPMPCSPNFMQTSQDQNQEEQQSSEQQPQNEAATAKNEDKKPDPCMMQLDKIMDNVRELDKKIQEFKGDKKSKEYRYLDEMLTRNLIKLDEIDSGGRDDVRKKRKESIQRINRFLSVLETKAKNQAETNNEILSELAEKSQN